MGSLLEPLAGIVDSAFVARLGTESLAALAVGVTIINSFSWVFNFLTHVIVESVSSSTVGEDSSEQSQTIGLSLLISGLIGTLTAVGLYLSRESLYELAGASRDIFSLVDAYFVIRIIGQPFSLLLTTQVSVIRGLGFVKQSTQILASNLLLNIALTFLLLFVLELGIAGAAWGTIFSHVLLSGVSQLLLRKKVDLSGNILNNLENKGILKSLSKKSVNLFVRSSLLTTIFFLSTRVAAHIGTVDLASYHIALQFWLFASFFTDGVAMVANIYGARLKKLGNWGLFKLLWKNTVIISVIIGAGFTFLYGIFGENLLILFTDKKDLIHVVLGYWWIIYGGQIINALAFSYDGLMFGLGGFHHLRNLMIFAFTCVFAPLAYIAHQQKNIFYVWFGLLALSIVRLIYIQLFIKKAFFESPKMS